MEYLLHHGLRESARRDPAKTAVVDGARHISYGALDRRSDEVAGLLRSRGVRRGDRVGIYAPKSLETVLAILGALKAGAVYVPVDPLAPPRRAAYILRNCDVRCLVASRAMARGLEPQWAGGGALAGVLLADPDEAPGAVLGVPALPLGAAGAAPPGAAKGG